MRLSATEVRRVCEGGWRDTFRQKHKLDPKPDLSSVFRVQMGVAVEPLARRWVSGRLGVAISTLDEVVPDELGAAETLAAGLADLRDPYGTGRYAVRGSWSAKPDGIAVRGVEGAGRELIVWEHKLVTNGDLAGDVVARFAPQLAVGMHVLGSRRGLFSVNYGGARLTTYQVAWCDA